MISSLCCRQSTSEYIKVFWTIISWAGLIIMWCLPLNWVRTVARLWTTGNSNISATSALSGNYKCAGFYVLHQSSLNHSHVLLVHGSHFFRADEFPRRFQYFSQFPVTIKIFRFFLYYACNFPICSKFPDRKMLSRFPVQVGTMYTSTKYMIVDLPLVWKVPL